MARFICSVLISLTILLPVGDVRGRDTMLRDMHRMIIEHRDESGRTTARRPEPRVTSDMGRVAIGLIGLYQTFISSQDRSVCNFTPSCSQFGQSAIRHEGIIKGLLLTFDRLQRCHPYALHLYDRDPRTGKFIDSTASHGGYRH